MVLLNLSDFPNVCRLCLQQNNENETYFDVNSFKNEEGLKLIDLMNEVFFPIPKDFPHKIPNYICKNCNGMFNNFYKYRENMNLLLRFIIAYSDFAAGNNKTLENLIQCHDDKLNLLLSELNICNEKIKSVKDLQYSDDELEEPSYDEPLSEHDNQSFKDDYSDYLLSDHDDFEVEKPIETIQNVQAKLSKRKVSLTISDTESDFAPTSPKKRRGPVKEKCDVKLKCDECSYKTYFKETLERHVEKHKTKKSKRKTIYKCHFMGCDLIFPNGNELRAHTRKLHTKFICDICGLAIKSKKTLAIHLRRHTGIATFKCDYCKSAFFTPLELKMHIEDLHVTTEQNCPVCGLFFHSKRALSRHAIYHSDERKYVCSQCPLTFKQSNQLKRHFDSVHLMIKIQCEHCEISYGRKDKLRNHMEAVHGIRTHFDCEICVKTFESNEKLEEHKELHKNTKELECPICLTVSLTKEKYDTHVCITYRENYICCGKDFRFHMQFNQHMLLTHKVRMNARVKPKPGVLPGIERAKRSYTPRCSKCKKGFRSKQQRDEHEVNCQAE